MRTSAKVSQTQRTPLRVCRKGCSLTCCIPLAPETRSHSCVPSGHCSDFHHHTHNNFTPPPGSHGCLPRSCPAHLYLQLLALQLANTRNTESVRLASHPSKALMRDSGESLQGWPSPWPAGFHPFFLPTCNVEGRGRHFTAHTSILESLKHGACSIITLTVQISPYSALSSPFKFTEFLGL